MYAVCKCMQYVNVCLEIWSENILKVIFEYLERQNARNDVGGM